jgi:MerR family copper efflux transcriptional regulator
MPQAKYFELSDARRDGFFNISQAAEASGVSAKMIRHYEETGLVPKAGRTVAGYRIYREADVHVLRFIRRSRDLGFTMKEIGGLLGLWQDRRRASADVKRLATKHMADLDARIAELQAMRRTLQTLVHCCHGDDRPDCPILDDLAGSGGA